MSLALDHLRKNDSDVRKTVDELERVAQSSESEAVADLRFDDQSGLLILKRAGQRATFKLQTPEGAETSGVL